MIYKNLLYMKVICFNRCCVILLCVVLSLIMSQLQAQGRTIKGVITDGSTNERFPGINIGVKGSTNSTMSRQDGSYHLDLPAGEVVLLVSFIGYHTWELTLDEGIHHFEINIQMGDDGIRLVEPYVPTKNYYQPVPEKRSYVRRAELEERRARRIEKKYYIKKIKHASCTLIPYKK